MMALEPITRAEQIMSGESLEPITREEMFLAKAAGMDVDTPKPITRREMFLSKISGGAGSGGTSSPVIHALEVTKNGTYEAPNGVDGYSPVTVNVAAGGGSSDEWFNDGNTHIWITLGEGRTSPMLGVCPNGTVTVDWGDGTTPDTLTGTSTSTVKWTPNHEYSKAGDYVITLTVDGEMGLYALTSYATSGILLHSTSTKNANFVYYNAIQRIEIGNGVTNIPRYAFGKCYGLSSIKIPEGVTSIGDYAFVDNYSLSHIRVPSSVTNIGISAFSNCYGLSSVVIPEGVTSIGEKTFSNCYGLSSIKIPEGVTSIGVTAFQYCYGLASVTIPVSVMSIGETAFRYCYGVRYYDFTHHTAVPALASTVVFKDCAADCEFRVPAALYDEWIAATNWTTYASQIVAV